MRRDLTPRAMRELSQTHRRLAAAYLALGDDPEPPAAQRSLPRSAGAVLATLTLALAAPLAWAATAPGKLPVDQPAATAAGKASAALAADDDDDGSGPPPGDDDHGPWPATNPAA
jgi:hypothetical protein